MGTRVLRSKLNGFRQTALQLPQPKINTPETLARTGALTVEDMSEASAPSLSCSRALSLRRDSIRYANIKIEHTYTAMFRD